MEKKKKNIKVLFISPYPIKGAGYRFRIAQFLPYFKESGIESAVSSFYSNSFFEIIYKPKRYGRKIFHFFIGIFRRICDVFRSLKCDIVFIYRDACPIGPPVFEWIFSRLKPVIYDFDDAIYLPAVSEANKFIKFLKYPRKVGTIVRWASHTIVCNDFLKRFALRFNTNISVIPTSVDTGIFVNIEKNSRCEKPVIGWIGSPTTAEYLPMLKNVFKRLAEKHDFSLKIIGAGKDIKIPGVDVMNQSWNLEKETSEYQNLDIGVYPLEGNEWDLGKTGFKTVVYMSVGIPAVVSDVGSNKQIIKDGVNGFLAATDEEWFNKISNLMKSPRLRHDIGRVAREDVVKRYSIEANLSKYISIFKGLVKSRYAKI